MVGGKLRVLLSKTLLCSEREERGSSHSPRAENSSYTGIITALCGQQWEEMLAKGNKAIVPTPLFRKKEQTARKGTTGVLNKSTSVEETKGLCWTALGVRQRPRCQSPAFSAVSPGPSNDLTVETTGVICDALVVSQTLCQALDWLSYPPWEAGNGIDPFDR